MLLALPDSSLPVSCLYFHCTKLPFLPSDSCFFSWIWVVTGSWWDGLNRDITVLLEAVNRYVFQEDRLTGTSVMIHSIFAFLVRNLWLPWNQRSRGHNNGGCYFIILTQTRVFLISHLDKILNFPPIAQLLKCLTGHCWGDSELCMYTQLITVKRCLIDKGLSVKAKQ